MTSHGRPRFPTVHILPSANERRRKLPDALIAATAMVHSLTLHTKNVRDFKPVQGLRLR